MTPDRIETVGKRGHTKVLCVLIATPGVFQSTHPICAEDVTACIFGYICYILLLTHKGGRRFWPQPVTPVELFLGQMQHHMARAQGPKLGSAFRHHHRYCQSRVHISIFHTKKKKKKKFHFNLSLHKVFHPKLKYYTFAVIILNLFLEMSRPVVFFPTA